MVFSVNELIRQGTIHLTSKKLHTIGICTNLVAAKEKEKVWKAFGNETKFDYHFNLHTSLIQFTEFRVKNKNNMLRPKYRSLIKNVEVACFAADTSKSIKSTKCTVVM